MARVLSMKGSSEVAVTADDFWLLLHGADAPPPVQPLLGRVVLLHGWLQTHDCWLSIATELRDRYGHDVLLIDFFGHGRTPVPSADVMSLEGWGAQLSTRLAAIGWDTGAPLSIAGCSLGAAVAGRFAASNPGRVARLTMVTPPGLPEAWYMPCYPVRAFAKALCAIASDELRAIDLLRVIRTTPEYGIPLDDIFDLVTRGALRLTVYVAGRDVIHTPHVPYWRAATARCARPDDADAMRFTLLQGRTHWGVCAHLHDLGLHLDESLWHATRDGGGCQRSARVSSTVSAAPLAQAPRARL